MKKAKRRAASPYHTITDKSGRKIAIVDATQGREFAILATDWESVRREFGNCWFARSNGNGSFYIGAKRSDVLAPRVLARTLMGAGRGQRVRYRDRNPMNLLRENLYIVSGPAKHAS